MISISQGAPGGQTLAAPAVLPEGLRIYAIGDIHGRPDLLGQIHHAVTADLKRGRPPRVLMVYVGDYIDRGEGAREVVDILSREVDDGVERVFLLGNHEDMMLGFLEGQNSGGTWMMNGGVATLRSYGVSVSGLPRGAEGAEAARTQLRANLPARHLAFLKKLALWHVEGDYLFVHAGIRPGVPLQRQTPADLMWIRYEFLDWPERLPQVVVHGHTVRPAAEVLPNRIGIDTGAYLSDCLTCAILESGTIRIIQT